MAEFYAYRVIGGGTPFGKVPEFLRERVKAILTEKGHSSLTAD